MINIIRKRLYSTSWKLLPNCPSPEYDTGCTHCQPTSFPNGLTINFERELNNTKVAPSKHILVLTHGYSNFDNMPSGITRIHGGLAHFINQFEPEYRDKDHSIQVSNIILSNQKETLAKFNLTKHEDQLVYIYPDNKIVKFHTKHVRDFVHKYLKKNQHETNLSSEGNSVTERFTEYKMEKDLALICGHTLTDARCGILGPVIQDEFLKVLEKQNLLTKVDVGLVSHIGGHAYAGNVIYFPKECDSPKDMVWYGRVFPKDVQGIVHETIMNKNILQNLLRGDPQLYQ
ncbi:Altered inheritance of mitochondria protein 32 [Spathaspora sp. JA1]|nr:Altered inheritance of mitochondria protein 32 [Spathaspora sp. JA1]